MGGGGRFAREAAAGLQARRDGDPSFNPAPPPTHTNKHTTHAHQHTLTTHAAESGLLARLLAALLRCCEPEAHGAASLAAQQACAECLGMIGAVDPARVQVAPPPPAATLKWVLLLLRALCGGLDVCACVVGGEDSLAVPATCTVSSYLLPFHPSSPAPPPSPLPPWLGLMRSW